MRKILKKFVLLSLITFGVSGCAEERTVATKPDVVVVERTSPPFANAAWIDNEYRWDGRTYVIVPAHWTKPNGIWVPGHWRNGRKQGFVWVGGHWKR